MYRSLAGGSQKTKSDSNFAKVWSTCDQKNEESFLGNRRDRERYLFRKRSKTGREMTSWVWGMWGTYVTLAREAGIEVMDLKTAFTRVWWLKTADSISSPQQNIRTTASQKKWTFKIQIWWELIKDLLCIKCHTAHCQEMKKNKTWRLWLQGAWI